MSCAHTAEKTNLRQDLKSHLPPPILHPFVLEKRTQDASQPRVGERQRRLDKAEEERNVACAEKESLAELVQELQSRLDKSEKERNTACTEKESLAEDLRSSQQLVQELQRRLDKSEKERNTACTEKESLAEDLLASQQLVEELLRRLKEDNASARATEGNLTENLHSSQQVNWWD
ncbi:M protein, serotype 2.1-like [Oscarella lobularis]|uniref:M protein, serotype 2.1-like n=1 Tax=Oscarella lobularis TaxID=121494 RepID=UPI00331333C7